MNVAYEPRSFIYEGACPPIGDEHDHNADQRFSDTDVAEHLSQYTAEAALLPDDGVIEEEARMLSEDDVGVQGPTWLDLSTAEFPSAFKCRSKRRNSPTRCPSTSVRSSRRYWVSSVAKL
jgi:hypothetical protein